MLHLGSHFANVAGDTLRGIFSPDRALVLAPVTALGAYLAGLFVIPPFDLIMWVVVAMGLDYVLGVLVAVRTRTWDITRLYDGGLGKIIRGFLLVPALLVDNMVLRLFGSLPHPGVEAFLENDPVPFTTLTIIYLISAEGFSMLDSVAAGAGRAAVPGFLQRALERIRDRLPAGDLDPPLAAEQEEPHDPAANSPVLTSDHTRDSDAHNRPDPAPGD